MNADYTQTIGQLHQIQDMLIGLVENLDDEQCRTVYQPGMHSIGWYLGQAVYLETFLIRELLQQDDAMTSLVRHLFAHDITPDAAIYNQLPPREHLLNWALELQEDNLVKLANPKIFGSNPALQPQWLASWLLQRHALSYENILIVLQAKAIQTDSGNLMVTTELLPELEEIATTHISQGHYRIGARDNETVFDNEQPAMMVELSNYRIAVKPVSNANYMAFMQDGGYNNQQLWSKQGWHWAQQCARHPWHWRQNSNQRWYEVNLLGAAELPPNEPVSGINFHEASAFSQWLAQQHAGYQGAVLQHEFQWETAARLGVLELTGRSREWCANSFEYYGGYQKPSIGELQINAPPQDNRVIKGVSLHSQPSIRRTSLRKPARPEDQHFLTGTRLVFPPGKPFWEQ